MRWLVLMFLACLAAPAVAQTDYAGQLQGGDVVLRGFRFGSGAVLPQLRIHYWTLGAPHRDGQGRIDNAVMILHGTGGTGRQFLAPQFADELFGPGQPLDIRHYYIILPDNIGHGLSSKPSDGMRMHFPAYDYDDMVEAQRQMLAALHVGQLRLAMGTSMGCMHIFVWAEAHPDFARAAMPMACLPVQLAGHNRMWREAAIQGIRHDPAWEGGNYRTEPLAGLPPDPVVPRGRENLPADASVKDHQCPAPCSTPTGSVTALVSIRWRRPPGLIRIVVDRLQVVTMMVPTAERLRLAAASGRGSGLARCQQDGAGPYLPPCGPGHRPGTRPGARRTFRAAGLALGGATPPFLGSGGVARFAVGEHVVRVRLGPGLQSAHRLVLLQAEAGQLAGDRDRAPSSGHPGRCSVISGSRRIRCPAGYGEGMCCCCACMTTRTAA